MKILEWKTSSYKYSSLCKRTEEIYNFGEEAQKIIGENIWNHSSILKDKQAFKGSIVE